MASRIDFKFIDKRIVILLAVLAMDIVLALIFFTGTAKIADPRHEAERIFAVCQPPKDYDPTECLREEFASLIKQKDFPFANQTLFYYQNLDPSSRNCHVLSHKIAQKLARSLPPQRWKELLGEIDPSMCGGGFMHGVIEVKIGDDPNFRLDASTIKNFCSDLYDKGPAESCVHILGHIIFLEKEGDFEKSLGVCVGLGGEFLFECYGGIFMEDSFRTNFEDHGLGKPPVRDMQWFEKKLQRCEKYSVNEVMGEGCFYDLAEVAAQTHNFDPKETYDICLKGYSEKAKERCYARASYIIATAPIPAIDSMDFGALCSYSFFNKHEGVERECITKTIGALLSYSLQFINRASKLCSTRSGLLEESCFQQIGNSSRNIWDTAERRQFCLAIPEKFRRFCN